MKVSLLLVNYRKPVILWPNWVDSPNFFQPYRDSLLRCFVWSIHIHHMQLDSQSGWRNLQLALLWQARLLLMPHIIYDMANLPPQGRTRNTTIRIWLVHSIIIITIIITRFQKACKLGYLLRQTDRQIDRQTENPEQLLPLLPFFLLLRHEPCIIRQVQWLKHGGSSGLYTDYS